MTTPDEARTFVRERTEWRRLEFLPELTLRLADDALTLWEATQRRLVGPGLAPPFWAFAWAGGQGLARYVLDDPAVVRGRRVLDLACGCGVVGIAAALAGAAGVMACDVDPFAVAATRMNAEANDATVSCVLGDLLDGDCPDVDVLLTGDVFFDRRLAKRMLPFLLRAAARGVDVLIGDPGRAYAPRELLREIAVYDVPVTEALESADVKTTTVWRV